MHQGWKPWEYICIISLCWSNCFTKLQIDLFVIPGKAIIWQLERWMMNKRYINKNILRDTNIMNWSILQSRCKTNYKKLLSKSVMFFLYNLWNILQLHLQKDKILMAVVTGYSGILLAPKCIRYLSLYHIILALFRPEMHPVKEKNGMLGKMVFSNDKLFNKICL